MDDANKQFGNGQQRSPHPRPYFYIQPPSQPYFIYPQWQHNNPYGHYGLPGTGGFVFGRPCMHPLQYMQYPGLVIPHAPIYPTDYRRVFEPRFHVPTWGDVPRPQQPPPHDRREMTCSEAQTDPSDTITKLIECLDKIRAGELQGANRELDSGVGSHSSAMFSPGEEKVANLAVVPRDCCVESTPVTLSESTTAANTCISNQTFLDTLDPQGCWSGGLEEEMPVDSSSVHEECLDLGQMADNKEEVMDIQPDISPTNQNVSRCDAKEPTNTAPQQSASSRDTKTSEQVSKDENQEVLLDEAEADGSCHIIKLPFNSVLTPGAAGAGRLCSPASPYYYNYLSTQTKTERMSVLSPSLDELSSRDEMFSTDLDDVDLFPKHIYTGRRTAEVIAGSPQNMEEAEGVWRPDSKRVVCACCGKDLTKGTGRSRVHSSSKSYRDEGVDSEEEESRYGRGCEQQVRVVVRKHSSPRKVHSVQPRHAGKHSHKRGLYKELSDPVEQEVAEGEVAEMDSNEPQCRTCRERVCMDDVATAEQGRWADDDVITRRRKETSTQWKLVYHRPRDEDQDEPLHWQRDMDAATSTLKQPFDLGPPGPNPPHAAQPSAPGPSGGSCPEEQHHKPFFYIHPPQPYVPPQGMQWPMAMAMTYNPYYGYPSLVIAASV
ncbi:bucky ball [Pholidichthys leucotaenia]